MTTQLHQTSRFGKQRCAQVPLAMSDWKKVEDAIAAARFWGLAERGGEMGLDGADWLIAARRRSDYHLVKRWSPDGALHDLGRLLFDLAGLADFSLY